MKPIAMPAKRPTADCIWNSFRNSNKRHLILTGDRGSGKTTLLNQLFPDKHPGITTWAEPAKSVFLNENSTDKTVQIGVFDPDLPGPGNQMTPLPEGFSTLGIPALMQCAASDNPWITIDEIGYLDSLCFPYQEALRMLMEKKQLAAVVRKQDLPFLQELLCREDSFVVDLDNPFGNIGCVIMASGLGKRFGSNKLLADFRGRPMINQILDATEEIFAQRVVVTRSKEVEEICAKRGIRAVLHDLPHRSDTVRLGLEAMPGIERCMFTTADQPLLRADTVGALALASANESDSIWRPVCEGVHGSPVVFPEWSFEELKHLPECKGGGVIIKKYPVRLRTVTVQDIYELKDVDCPKDLEELLKR